MGKALPFEGVRVVDLTTYIAAPSCGRILADWGAEVIKIEPPTGELFRRQGDLAWKVPADEQENTVFDLLNANKKSLPLNLRDEKGKEIMHKLIKTADIFLTNNRAQALAKMGLDWETLHQENPQLIFATILGYGEKGPEKDAPGYDTIAFWARSGFLADQAVASGYPVVLPGGEGDLITGATLFGAIAAALYNRTKTGMGDKVDVSLLSAGLWYASYMAVTAQPGCPNVYPKERTKGNVLMNEYKTQDGVWMAVAVSDYARDFAKFCKLVGKEEWIDDERYNTRIQMNKHGEDTIPELEEIFASKPFSYWDEKFKAADIVYSRLSHYSEILQNEQALANDFSFKYHYPNGNDKYMANIPMHSEYVGTPEFHVSPLLGADTDKYLAELGYSEADIAAFKEAGITK